MATIDVKDAAGATVALEKPLVPGSAADAASRPVAFSTEGKAQLGSLTETAPATDTASSGINGRLQRLAQRITSLITALGTPFQAGGTIGGITNGVNPRMFSAACTQLTRPANTTPYTALDSISNNGTAASVTALVSGNASDTNDAPVCVTHIEIKSSDTGLANKSVRVRVYNTDYTASSGVVAGDNAAFSNKQAGLQGIFTGVMDAASDGAVGNLVPESGAPYIEMAPVSGARTLYVNHQAVDGFTPSANSTTIDTTIHGIQGRAA